MRVNLPELKTATGKIVNISFWLKFCESSPDKRGYRDGCNIISAGDLLEIDSIILWALAKGINPRDVMLGKC